MSQDGIRRKLMGQSETSIVRIEFPQSVFRNREYFHYIIPRLLLLYSSPTGAFRSVGEHPEYTMRGLGPTEDESPINYRYNRCTK